MLKLGAVRVHPVRRAALPDGGPRTFAPVIIVLSLIAIIYGAIVALVQPDLKRLVAYSSVSHMGFVTLGIFVFTEQGLQGAILQMINHGLITGRPVPAGRGHLRADPRPDDRQDGRAARADAGLGRVFGFFVFASAGLPGCPGSSASSSCSSARSRPTRTPPRGRRS
jgi:NADH-quinone oxidoreductase subunit M